MVGVVNGTGRRTRRGATALAVCASLVLAACSGGDDGDTTAPTETSPETPATTTGTGSIGVDAEALLPVASSLGEGFRSVDPDEPLADDVLGEPPTAATARDLLCVDVEPEAERAYVRPGEPVETDRDLDVRPDQDRGRDIPLRPVLLSVSVLRTDPLDGLECPPATHGDLEHRLAVRRDGPVGVAHLRPDVGPFPPTGLDDGSAHGWWAATLVSVELDDAVLLLAFTEVGRTTPDVPTTATELGELVDSVVTHAAEDGRSERPVRPVLEVARAVPESLLLSATDLGVRRVEAVVEPRRDAVGCGPPARSLTSVFRFSVLERPRSEATGSVDTGAAVYAGADEAEAVYEPMAARRLECDDPTEHWIAHPSGTAVAGRRLDASMLLARRGRSIVQLTVLPWSDVPAQSLLATQAERLGLGGDWIDDVADLEVGYAPPPED